MEAQPHARPPRGFGLALSGGGFRAAFFHIGVLAWLAEHRLLRRMEVLATVSGGSIIGALYYLHVRNLLQAKTADEIGDEDYIEIVKRLEKDFLPGVERNLRGRGFANLGKNFKMACPSYSRTNRIGELYDATFYSPAWNESRNTMIRMQELTVQPKGELEGFNPAEDNERRPEAPVPILILNATSLNTGHNWRFEAVGMGEPDLASPDVPESKVRDRARREVDRNDRLRWTRYDKLPNAIADFELGHAVAASSCVPTLFHPLPIPAMFVDEEGNSVTAELVDGGVHDNQGIAGLLEYDCSPIIVSDASGYLRDEDKPATRIPAVLARTVGIYGDRVREEQLIEARLRENERPLGLVHLRKGIAAWAISPLGPDGAPLAQPRREPPESFQGEQFPVDRDVQDALSKMRTDLDSFTEVEAYSLMYDGYVMSGPNLRGVIPPDSPRPVPRQPWRFLQVEVLASGSQVPGSERYHRHLRAGETRFGKSFALSWPARLLGLILLGVVGFLAYLVSLVDAFRGFFAADVQRWWLPALILVAFALAFLYVNTRLPKPLRLVANFLYTQVVPALLAPFLFLGARLLLGFSRLFVASGRLSRVLR